MSKPCSRCANSTMYMYGDDLIYGIVHIEGYMEHVKNSKIIRFFIDVFKHIKNSGIFRFFSDILKYIKNCRIYRVFVGILSHIMNKGILRSLIGGLVNGILLVLLFLLLGKDGCGQYTSWKKRRTRKHERMCAGRESDDSDRLLMKWREIWSTLPRAEWEREWKLLPRENMLDGFEDDMVFCRMFCNSYHATKLKAERNRQKNFFWKKAFLVVLSIGMASFLAWSFGVWGSTGGEIEEIILKNGIFLLGITLFCRILAKWIDVKKYQETWVRHSGTQHALEVEMLLFISQLEPYQASNRKTVFFSRTLEIWNKNQGKFGSNMEDKEKGMTDVINDVKSWVRV